MDGLKLGMTRCQVRDLMGAPINMGIGTRKYPAPSVYRYGTVEIGFGPKWNDGLVYVMDIGTGEEHNFILGGP